MGLAILEGAGAPGRSVGSRSAGSGLIIVLAILAILAVMATSFVTLTRLDVKAAANYVDDQRCELLAMGAMNYFRAILRDDLDRTWNKYQNRTAAVGAIGYAWGGSGATLYQNLPGLTENRYGTPVGRQFWFNAPVVDWTDWGALYANEYGNYQLSFSGSTGYSHCITARFWDAANNRDVDIWVSRCLCCWGRSGTPHEGMVVHQSHPDAGAPIDFDADGVPRPTPDINNGQFNNQEGSDTNYYYDTGIFVVSSGSSYYLPGSTLTNQLVGTKGVYWRYGVKLGVPHGMYLDLNSVGNLDGATASLQPSSYLNNIGNIGLVATRAEDEAASTVQGRHLGRLHWKGFQNGGPNGGPEAQYNQGGFPRFYDEVNYLPSQISMESLFERNRFTGISYVLWDNGTGFNLSIPREKARSLLQYRLGAGERAGDGTDRFRPGWRRDGASYYKLTSPDNPIGQNRFFGANEVIEHDHAAYNPSTSAIAGVLTQGEWRRLRPYATFWSADTILRGKIWPTEGPLPWRSAAAGNWRHIDILKRVNINIVGATGASLGLPGEDLVLKARWAAKAPRERDRLYFMLLAGMRYSNLPATDTERRKAACQFIASLEDMVDPDREESCYIAPDGSGAWGLGVEKSPVINEVAFFSNTGANTANYSLYRLRVELYNPTANVPWIPDADEAIDVSQYVLQVGSHYYRVGALHRFANDSSGYTDVGAIDASPKIGADGMYGVPVTGYYLGSGKEDPSWSRFLQVGWMDPTAPAGSAEFPKGVTYEEFQGGPTPTSTTAANFQGVTITLWKPVSLPGAVPDSTYIITNPTGVPAGRYLCVDTTGPVKLVRPWDPTKGEGGPGQIAGDPDGCPNRNKTIYSGVYRRWDPMNARVYEDPSLGKQRYGKGDKGSVIWCPGWTLARASTMGRPNVEYWPNMYSIDDPGTAGAPPSPAAGRYWRHHEREVKIVDGDLPSLGWMGELFLWNRGTDGPLTWVSAEAQAPLGLTSETGGFEGSRSGTTRGWKNQLDTRAKFDLFRPFGKVTSWQAQGEWDPYSGNCPTENLQMLDIFTVWDPSNDGIDNDGDGAVDDDDTGLQAGDKFGPEVRVFGRIDTNMVTRRVAATVFPDNSYCHGLMDALTGNFRYGVTSERKSGGGGQGCWGAQETIGDLMRADGVTIKPGGWLSGNNSMWIEGPQNLCEGGFQDFTSNAWGATASDPSTWKGDDNGNGIFDERSERDMVFTWVSNYLTTRSNVFEIDLMVAVSDPPFYPGSTNNSPRQLPLPAYKSPRIYAKKQIVGILDRSTCLRILPGGVCDFTGPVDIRMLRFSDDKRAY